MYEWTNVNEHTNGQTDKYIRKMKPRNKNAGTVETIQALNVFGSCSVLTDYHTAADQANPKCLLCWTSRARFAKCDLCECVQRVNRNSIYASLHCGIQLAGIWGRLGNRARKSRIVKIRNRKGASVFSACMAIELQQKCWLLAFVIATHFNLKQ